MLCLWSWTHAPKASYPGFVKAGFARAEATQLLRDAVRVAVQARDEYVRAHTPCSDCTSLDSTDAVESDTIPCTTCTRIVAASIGPYGAFLANGAEYTGDYGNVSDADIEDFHAERLETICACAGVDILACETIPCGREAEILARLLRTRFTSLPVWFSFSCKDSYCLRNGDRLATCVQRVKNIMKSQVSSVCPPFHRATDLLARLLALQLVAVGVNCVHPAIVEKSVGVLLGNHVRMHTAEIEHGRVIGCGARHEGAASPKPDACCDDADLGRKSDELCGAGAGGAGAGASSQGTAMGGGRLMEATLPTHVDRPGKLDAGSGEGASPRGTATEHLVAAMLPSHKDHSSTHSPEGGSTHLQPDNSAPLVVVYPNRGELWDAERKVWYVHRHVGAGATKDNTPTDEELVDMMRSWIQAGAACVGGCCRTRPATIRLLATATKR